MVASAEQTSLLDSQFYSKQCREQFVTPLSCFPQSSCNSFAFRTLALLLDLDDGGGLDPLFVFPLFLKMVADIIAPKSSVIFRGLIHLGSFPKCWRSAYVTAIPKGASFSDRENYRPISITPILSKVHEKLVSHKLSSFLPAAQFAYKKGLGCTDELLTISHHLQKSTDKGMESYIV